MFVSKATIGMTGNTRGTPRHYRSTKITSAQSSCAARVKCRAEEKKERQRDETRARVNYLPWGAKARVPPMAPCRPPLTPTTLDCLPDTTIVRCASLRAATPPPTLRRADSERLADDITVDAIVTLSRRSRANMRRRRVNPKRTVEEDKNEKKKKPKKPKKPKDAPRPSATTSSYLTQVA